MSSNSPQVTMPRYDLCDNGGILVRGYAVQTNVTGRWAINRYVELTKDGVLRIKKGYKWDFGTGAIDTPAVILASLIHDGLCDLIADTRLPKSYRRKVDKEYKRFLKIGGMGFLRRQWQYYLIRFYVRLLKPIFG